MQDLDRFWEDMHARDDGTWLTGTGINAMLDFYKITPADFQNQTVLEIGIGRKTVTQWLSRAADTLYCSDISHTALAHARSMAKACFHTLDLDQCPPVDVALCHLVFVHCDDDEVRRILRSIKLNPSGRLFCQFSGLKHANSINQASDHVKKLLTEAGPHFFRGRDEIEQMVADSSMTITKCFERDPGSYHGWSEQVWFCLECQKN